MRVYVIRHAAAAPHEDYERDEERPLTKRGERTARLMGEALSALQAAPEVIYTSPLVRARRTAILVADELGVDIEEAFELATGHGAAEVVALLAGCGREEAAVVGHEPQLGEVVSLLVTGGREPVVDMKKSAVARVDFAGAAGAGEGVVAWHIVPEVVEALTRD